MNELLELAINAHGGLDRWNQIDTVTAQMSITGAIWEMKGKGGLLDDVTLAAKAHTQRATITPFKVAGQRSTWVPDLEQIETLDGKVLDERRDPLASFAGHTRQTPWDDFHLIYFASYANWNYFVSPFLFARSDFAVEELAPWAEDGEEWRSLKVTYPESVAAHSREQTYYFDRAGLLKRIDYAVDIFGSGPAVHYPSEYREFGGILVPTRRRVYVRRSDGSPILESVSIAIDIADVTIA